jgi:CheY-like chemotaxis protein
MSRLLDLGPQGGDSARLKGLNILIVEDDPLLSQTLKEALERVGAEVLGAAYSASRAIEALEAKRPDLVLLDINLLDQLDFSVADRLSELVIPFIFLTGYDAETLPERYRCRPLLGKPHHLRDLVDLIGKVAGLTCGNAS